MGNRYGPAALLLVVACGVIAGGCGRKGPAGPALTEKETAYVREKLSGMTDAVELVSFTDGKAANGDRAVALYDAIAALNPKVSHRRQKLGDDAARAANIVDAPAVLLSKGTRTRIVHLGLPAGYEFPTFIETIDRLSRNESGRPPAAPRSWRP